MRMNFKDLVTKDSYRIDPTPLGGYVARSDNPDLPTIEGSTKEDVERQIEAKIEASIEQAVPDTFGKFGLTSHRSVSRFSYRMEEKPDGGIIARPSDPAMGVIEGLTREEVQQKINEKLGALIGKQLPSSFGATNDVDITSKTRVSVQFLHGNSSTPSTIAGNQMRMSSAPGIRVSFNSGSVGRIVRFLLTVAVVATLIYFYRHH
jgi:hypothetical protein